MSQYRLKIHLPITADLTLVFYAPTAEQQRRAALYSQAERELDAQEKLFAHFAEIEDQLLACVCMVNENADVDSVRSALKEDGLLWGPTGVGIWQELFFRDYRQANRPSHD